MQFKVTPGSGAAGLGIVGAGLAMAFPDQRWIGFVLIGLGALVFLFDLKFERGHVEAGKDRLGQFLSGVQWSRGRKVVVVGMAVGGVATLGLIGFYVWPEAHKQSQFRGAVTAFAEFEVSGQLGLSNVVPVVDVRNTTQSGVYITAFSLKIQFPDGSEKETTAQPVIDQMVFRGRGGYVEVNPDNTLWGKDGAPPIHGFRSGRLWFAFSGISNPKEMSKDDTRLTLTIKDSQGLSSSSTLRVGDIQGPRMVSPTPAVSTNPPAASPPSPTPPETPTKK